MDNEESHPPLPLRQPVHTALSKRTLSCPITNYSLQQHNEVRQRIKRRDPSTRGPGFKATSQLHTTLGEFVNHFGLSCGFGIKGLRTLSLGGCSDGDTSVCPAAGTELAHCECCVNCCYGQSGKEIFKWELSRNIHAKNATHALQRHTRWPNLLGDTKQIGTKTSLWVHGWTAEQVFRVRLGRRQRIKGAGRLKVEGW